MDLSTIIEKLDKKDALHLLGCGRRGIEKEGLRYTQDNQLSEKDHPKSLGSTLTHSEITTDYAESLVEIVTPAFRNSRDTLNHLAYLHRVVAIRTGEYMLNASMPAYITDTEQVKIGYYGESNAGMMRTLYRKGLALRYGKAMQLIAGVHFNYSICNDLFRHYANILNKPLDQEFIDARYMNLVRNIRIYGWIIPYLFGHSPALDRSFFKNRPHQLKTLDDDTLYLPYATSLRMSDIGYQNKEKQSVSANTLHDYIFDLKTEVKTPSKEYQKLGLRDNAGRYQQINTNILQIENEYYTAARPKQIAASGETQLNALYSRGISYVELRLLDINCFAPCGIDEEQLDFLEMYMLFCLFKEAPLLDDALEQETKKNISDVSCSGRNPDLMLNHQGKKISIPDWGQSIIDEMQVIANAMDYEKHRPHHSSILEHFEKVFADPNQTPSAKIIKKLQGQDGSNPVSYHQFITKLSREQANQIRKNKLSNAEIQKIEADSQDSLLAEKELVERTKSISFDDYLQEYFTQLEDIV